jgi:hypothetical protein
MKSEPAFPQNERVTAAISIAKSQGMTLRDYFAAKAMPPMLHANAGKWAGNYDAHAKMAYEFADAMLKAREA